jgi:hypothetical protein
MAKQMPNHVNLVPRMRLIKQIKQAAVDGDFAKMKKLQSQLKNSK